MHSHACCQGQSEQAQQDHEQVGGGEVDVGVDMGVGPEEMTIGHV